MQKVSRNRVYRDRLWDNHGTVWRRVLGEWLDADAVEELLRGGTRAVVQTFEGPMCWLTPQQAREEWKRIRPYFQQPGADEGDSPVVEQAARDVTDADEFSYTGIAWRCGGDRLIGFHQSC